MSKPKVRYVCQSCGHESLKWSGKCPSCHEWNSLIEEIKSAGEKPVGAVPWIGQERESVPIPLPAVAAGSEARVETGFGELDRVLGGGLVAGSLILLGGDPGIGKSTILMQLCERVARIGLNALYVSGEESAAQIKMRADRLGAISGNISVLTETDIERVRHFVEIVKPSILIIDSIQTMYDGRIESAPGSVGQVRECTAQITAMAKGLGVVCFLIGHVTKAGAIAGPRVLEHMVDTVLYFEGDRHHQYRILRSVKNRFGSTNEIGVFEIKDTGLTEVPNPSGIWLGQNTSGIPGSIVTCSVEGSRPFLVEVQALVTSAGIAMPRRLTTGIDHNRAAIIMAVLEKRAGLILSGQDAYISVVGGFELDEPSSDLAVALAIASSFKNRPTPRASVAFGEVGLAGEIRGVSRIDVRVKEAAKLGFKRCFIPKCSLPSLDVPESMEIVCVESVNEALDTVLGGVYYDER